MVATTAFNDMRAALDKTVDLESESNNDVSEGVVHGLLDFFMHYVGTRVVLR